MDAIDLEIIEILKENARITMRELGNMISMSNTATAERIKKMEDAGVIAGYGAMIDQGKLGNTTHVFIMLEFTYNLRERPEQFFKYARENKYIVSAYPVFTGGMDYLIEIYCAETRQLEKILQDMVEFGFTTTYLAGGDMMKKKADE
ncbi:Lrp/AsnC family transcriptional regulator [Christensenellaceae bacterium OttesenSCG-928-M15]|nr:Lrp/AsnC family transcriptional regulator [Christensenellaceae bacterium OttesenSCG-928-M15]